MLLLLLLFHPLLHDHPLFSSCGPTCYVKKSSLWEDGSTGKLSLRTSSPAGPQHMLTQSLLLWWKHVLSHYITCICYTTLPKATCNRFENHKGERTRYHLYTVYPFQQMRFCFLQKVQIDVEELLGHVPASICIITALWAKKQKTTMTKVYLTVFQCVLTPTSTIVQHSSVMQRDSHTLKHFLLCLAFSM